jgi:hypothetical protein
MTDKKTAKSEPRELTPAELAAVTGGYRRGHGSGRGPN